MFIFLVWDCVSTPGDSPDSQAREEVGSLDYLWMKLPSSVRYLPATFQQLQLRECLQKCSYTEGKQTTNK